MIKFLTSDFNNYEKINGIKIAKKIDNTNGFIDTLKYYLEGKSKVVFVVSNGELSHEENKIYADIFFKSLEMSGISFNEYCILEKETKEEAEEMILSSNLIYLCGGDPIKQMNFFNEIHLKEILSSYDGIVVGQSAGAINMAKNTFNSPEERDCTDLITYEGLGLTNINVEPHFIYDASYFNEDELYQRKCILEESMKRRLIGQCNGSHIVIDDNNNIVLSGESYLIDNGKIELLCSNGKNVNLYICDERNLKKING